MMPLIPRRRRSLLSFWAMQTSEAVELVPISFMHAMIKIFGFYGQPQKRACMHPSILPDPDLSLQLLPWPPSLHATR